MEIFKSANHLYHYNGGRVYVTVCARVEFAAPFTEEFQPKMRSIRVSYLIYPRTKSGQHGITEGDGQPYHYTIPSKAAAKINSLCKIGPDAHSKVTTEMARQIGNDLIKSIEQEYDRSVHESIVTTLTERLSETLAATKSKIVRESDYNSEMDEYEFYKLKTPYGECLISNVLEKIAEMQ